MMLSEFVQRNAELSKVRGHAKENLIRDLLEECLDTDERVIAAMFLCGRLAYVHESYTTGIKETFIANDLALEGMNSHEAMEPFILQRAAKMPSKFSITQVWEILRIYVESDERTKFRKSRLITSCMQTLAGAPEDAVFLLRLLTGKMGNGADEKTILHAVWGPNHDREKFSRLYAFNPDIAAWVGSRDRPDHSDEREALFRGMATPGVPMEPQLCARVKNLETVLEAHTQSLVQTKLDGMRVHIHLRRTKMGRDWVRQVQFFSREQKDITNDYPELFKQFGKVDYLADCILDGELVALAQDGSVAPFSRLQKRLGRKTGRSAYQVGIVLYDVLLYDDFAIMRMTYEARLKILKSLRFGPNVRVIESKLVGNVETLHAMLLEAHEAGEEGLVCKDPLSLPSPGMRSIDWVKAKADYMDSTEFGDSYDLIVVGYNRGKGRRHGTVGALWVAARGETGLEVLCKVGTGFKDEDLEWFRTKLEPIGPMGMMPFHFNNSGIEVPVNVDLVVEVKAAQVSQDEKGAYSLRFPRFIRVREDKEPRNATTMKEIREAMP